MDYELVANYVIMSVLGAGAYNTIMYVSNGLSKSKWGYDPLKAARTGLASVIQIIACVVSGWIPPENIQDQIMIGGFAATGIDQALKTIWKIKESPK